MVKRDGPVLFLVLIYRKLLFFFAWVNYLQVWWAGLAHWRVTRDIGVCSWEKGRERLPLDLHQCLELAVSYLGTFILWELSSSNDPASHLFFPLVVAECLFPTQLPSFPPPPPKKRKKRNKKNPKPKNKQKNLSYPLLSVSQKTWGLKIKRFCFLEVGALVFESRLYFLQ